MGYVIHVNIKFTVRVTGPEAVVPLQDSVLTTTAKYVFPKKSTIFWEYKNIHRVFQLARDSKGALVIEMPGYYTFNQLKEIIESHDKDTTLTTRPFDLRCELTTGGAHDFLMSNELCQLLGFDHSFDNNVLGPFAKCDTYVSENPVDIKAGLRYVQVHCNLVNNEKNYNSKGERSTALTSLPVTSSQPLVLVVSVSSSYGSVSSFFDTESKVPVLKGAFDRIVVKGTDQDGNPIDVGEILLEFYVE